jgi:hypothetical protein
MVLQIPPALFLRYIYMDVDPPAAEGDDLKPITSDIIDNFCHAVVADPSQLLCNQSN